MKLSRMTLLLAPSHSSPTVKVLVNGPKTGSRRKGFTVMDLAFGVIDDEIKYRWQ
jgi:hypothetical protein